VEAELLVAEAEVGVVVGAEVAEAVVREKTRIVVVLRGVTSRIKAVMDSSLSQDTHFREAR
jgi:hypothetical protein